MELGGRRIQATRGEGKVQEAVLQVHPAGQGRPPRQRLRRVPLNGPQRPALHREDRDAVGDRQREHDGQGQVVLPPGGDRDLWQEVRPEAAGN